MSAALREKPNEVGQHSINADSRFYRPELDSLRFFAFLLVFVCHSTPAIANLSWPRVFLFNVSIGGLFGVDLFFLLSAYLITELLRREKAATGSIDLRSFYVRRVLRIWPLYLGFLILFFVSQRSKPETFPPQAFAAFVLFCGNWYMAGRELGTPMRSAVVPLWSVSVEEQFYLVWPLVARFANRAVMMIAAGCLGVASLATLFVMLLDVTSHAVIWLNSLVHGAAISIGILSALVLDGRVPRIHWLLRIVMVIAALLLFAVAEGFFYLTAPIASITDGIGAFACGWLAVSLFFFAFLGAPQDGLKLTAGGAFAYLGRISYGLYIFHMASLDLTQYALLKLMSRSEPVTRSVLALVLTMAVAAASYRWYERPFLALKQRFSRISSGAM